jgi:hypothetical protein
MTAGQLGTMPKERTRRYSIEVKDATGRSVWFAAADWTDEETAYRSPASSHALGSSHCHATLKLAAVRQSRYIIEAWPAVASR